MVPGFVLAASLVISSSQLAQIDAAVAAVMQADHITGLSLGIAKDGAVALRRSYGDATVDTIYRIGSLTKQFTAALVLQETERGALTLATPAGGGITVQQLLAQTSGLSDETPSQLFDPGTGWHYSNLNYVRLGAVLQTATGEPFAQLLDERILMPLHLSSTTVGSDDAAAVGISSDVNDLLAWLHALRSGRIISDADFSAMATSQTLPTGERTHYGYGWYVRNWYGWRCIEHPGYVPGYSADDALVVDDGLAIVVLAKANNAFLLPISKTVVSLLEKPRDESLVADFHHPAENENPAVTRDVRDVLHQLQTGTLDRTRLSPALDTRLTTAWAAQERAVLEPLGDATLIEFIGRSVRNGTTLEKYRVSFGYKQFWMTIAYDRNGKIDTLLLEPDEE